MDIDVDMNNKGGEIICSFVVRNLKTDKGRRGIVILANRKLV